jgi:hypothetical protein
MPLIQEEAPMPVTDARPTKRGHKYRAVIEVAGPKTEKEFKKFYKALKAATRPRWARLKEKFPPKSRRG